VRRAKEKGFHDPEALLLNDGVYDKLYFQIQLHRCGTPALAKSRFLAPKIISNSLGKVLQRN
jgi:hypothetical protein